MKERSQKTEAKKRQPTSSEKEQGQVPKEEFDSVLKSLLTTPPEPKKKSE